MRPMAILLLLATVLSLFGLSPFPAYEIARMKPAELLLLQSAEGGVLAQTEEGLSAWGGDPEEALKTLRLAAAGDLFFATVENVVLTDLPVPTQTLITAGIRPGTAVYTAEKTEDGKALNDYLKTHSAGVTLGMLEENPSKSIPALQQGQSGLYLEEASHD